MSQTETNQDPDVADTKTDHPFYTEMRAEIEQEQSRSFEVLAQYRQVAQQLQQTRDAMGPRPTCTTGHASELLQAQMAWTNQSVQLTGTQQTAKAKILRFLRGEILSAMHWVSIIGQVGETEDITAAQFRELVQFKMSAFDLFNAAMTDIVK